MSKEPSASMIRISFGLLLWSMFLAVSSTVWARTDAKQSAPVWMSDWTLRLTSDMLPARLYDVRANASGLFVNVDGALVRVSFDGHEAWQFRHCVDCGTSVLDTERIYDFVPLDDGGAWVAVGARLGSLTPTVIKRVLHIDASGGITQEWALDEALGAFWNNVKLVVRDEQDQRNRAWLLMGTEDGIKRLSFNDQLPGSIPIDYWSPGGSNHQWMVAGVVWNDASSMSIHMVDTITCAPLMPCPSAGYLIHWPDSGDRLEFPYFFEYGLLNGFLLLPGGSLARVYYEPPLDIAFSFMHFDGTFSDITADFPTLQSTYAPTVWAVNDNLLLQTELDGVLLFNTEGTLLGQFDKPKSEGVHSAGKQLMVAETFESESPYTRLDVDILDAASLAVIGTVSPISNIPVYDGPEWLVGTSNNSPDNDKIFAYEWNGEALILQRYSQATPSRQARLFAGTFENTVIAMQ